MLLEAIKRYQKAKFVIDEVRNKHTKEFIDATDNLISEVKLESELNKATYLALTRENESVSRVISEFRIDYVLGKETSKGWLSKAIVKVVEEGYSFNGFAFEKGSDLILKKSV